MLEILNTLLSLLPDSIRNNSLVGVGATIVIVVIGTIAAVRLAWSLYRTYLRKPTLMFKQLPAQQPECLCTFDLFIWNVSDREAEIDHIVFTLLSADKTCPPSMGAMEVEDLFIVEVDTQSTIRMNPGGSQKTPMETAAWFPSIDNPCMVVQLFHDWHSVKPGERTRLRYSINSKAHLYNPTFHWDYRFLQVRVIFKSPAPERVNATLEQTFKINTWPTLEQSSEFLRLAVSVIDFYLNRGPTDSPLHSEKPSGLTSGRALLTELLHIRYVMEPEAQTLLLLQKFLLGGSSASLGALRIQKQLVGKWTEAGPPTRDDFIRFQSQINALKSG
ncbi:MAG: hypothetical protein K1X70_09685 [Leptospirales bacterium]|nr:hypothetical protein [Leptospirales bacterium]